MDKTPHSGVFAPQSDSPRDDLRALLFKLHSGGPLTATGPVCHPGHRRGDVRPPSARAGSSVAGAAARRSAWAARPTRPAPPHAGRYDLTPPAALAAHLQPASAPGFIPTDGRSLLVTRPRRNGTRRSGAADGRQSRSGWRGSPNTGREWCMSHCAVTVRWLHIYLCKDAISPNTRRCMMFTLTKL